MTGQTLFCEENFIEIEVNPNQNLKIGHLIGKSNFYRARHNSTINRRNIFRSMTPPIDVFIIVSAASKCSTMMQYYDCEHNCH
jgi:hypothetical protein